MYSTRIILSDLTVVMTNNYTFANDLIKKKYIYIMNKRFRIYLFSVFITSSNI